MRVEADSHWFWKCCHLLHGSRSCRKFCAKLLGSDWYSKSTVDTRFVSRKCDGLYQFLWRSLPKRVTNLTFFSGSPLWVLFGSSMGPRILLNGSSVLLEIRGGKEENPRRQRGGNEVPKRIQRGRPGSHAWMLGRGCKGLSADISIFGHVSNPKLFYQAKTFFCPGK